MSAGYSSYSMCCCVHNNTDTSTVRNITNGLVKYGLLLTPRNLFALYSYFSVAKCIIATALDGPGYFTVH